MRFFLFLGLILLTSKSQGQLQTEVGKFSAYMGAGGQTTQMVNDSIGGFKKWGLYGGIGVQYMIAERFSANLELAYSQRGSTGSVFNEFDQATGTRAFTVNYFEAPLLFHYHDRKIASFGAGVVLGVPNQEEFYRNDSLIQKGNMYQNLDIALALNATLNIKDRFGFNLRFTHSVGPATLGSFGEEHFHSVLMARLIWYIF
ncbi:MAG: PorT family protein [Chitinophagales bacterium]|jgi:hypothetical protein|nr:PorT family protein [Chitinophagales bacterium]